MKGDFKHRTGGDAGRDGGEFSVVLYSSSDGRVVVNALVKDETLWMTQAGMAELFGVKPQAITYHLKNIHQSGELDEAATCKEILQVQNEGGRGGGEKTGRGEIWACGRKGGEGRMGRKTDRNDR